MDKDILETKGVSALRRLYEVACGHSGQCRYVAAFLLGLYNGQRFPFDLTDLRAIDAAFFEDCMTVLRMDARLTRQEVHRYFDEGGKKFNALAEAWNIDDVLKIREDAKRASQPVGAPASLHDGGHFEARLSTYGDAPGYRDVTIYLRCGPASNTEVCLKLTPDDGETLMQHIMRVHDVAWNNGSRGPLDAKDGEKRPAWLDRAPARWAA